MYYRRVGEVPHKRHTQFRKADGGLFREEVMGVHGFFGIASILYHHHEPTRLLKVEDHGDAAVRYADFGPLRYRHLVTADVAAGGDAVGGRQVLLGNGDVTLAVARPTEPMATFYRNAQAYELIFVSEGAGTLRSMFGPLPFSAGDYLVIPFSVTWRMDFDGPANRLLVLESRSQIVTPERYRNRFGQHLEHSPFCERDFRAPETLETHDEMGEFPVLVKMRDAFALHVLDHHPFDVVGWDGHVYPWAFNIGDFEPITGRVHQPPPVHQTFEGDGFVVCSFVPRLFDYHPLAIPAPYNHANVNSDEVLFYHDGEFMSRRGVGKYDITLHPAGLPHGPHPGAVEASIGKPGTGETAVMLDTFRPLQLTAAALALEDRAYVHSWLPGAHGPAPDSAASAAR